LGSAANFRITRDEPASGVCNDLLTGLLNDSIDVMKAYLSRRYRFSASHRLHSEHMSEAENRATFGKCNNPHGHGHNYVLEVTVAGTPDPNTGMVLDLKELKEILQREIIERMDHRFLNYEVPELAGQIPTCENIAAVIWNLLDPKITKGTLHRV